MAYDRYDTRNDPRGERSRWRDDDRSERSWRGEREHGHSDRGEDRGWLERAGDQIASWFGDDDDDRGRQQERGQRDWQRERGQERGSFFGRDDNDDRGRFWRDRSWDRGDFERGEQRSRMPSGWGARGQDRHRDFDRNRERHDYRPMTGDYGRSEQFFAASGTPRGGFGEEDRFRRDRSDSPWGRDEYRRTSRAGSSNWSDRSRERGDFDPHYSSWRERHMSELDRDYEDYRRENQSRFEDEFAGWRQQRQQKRSLLGQIREHMEVVGSDDEHVGTIDRVAGDRIILTRSDPESGGVHHSLMCTDIDRIEGERVLLSCTADQAKKRWRDESRDRALFEREDQGEAGPHMLDRSFEGTYR
jgi:hypothetical protein